MTGRDYLFAGIAVLLLWDMLARPGKSRIREDFGRFGPQYLAVFAAGALLIIDQAVVGHSNWLYAVGGVLVAGSTAFGMWLEEREKRNEADDQPAVRDD